MLCINVPFWGRCLQDLKRYIERVFIRYIMMSMKNHTWTYFFWSTFYGFFESLDFQGTFLDALGAEMVDLTSRNCDLGIWWGHHGRYSAIWYGCVMMCPMESPRCYFPDEKSFKLASNCEPNGGLSIKTGISSILEMDILTYCGWFINPAPVKVVFKLWNTP